MDEPLDNQPLHSDSQAMRHLEKAKCVSVRSEDRVTEFNAEDESKKSHLTDLSDASKDLVMLRTREYIAFNVDRFGLYSK